MCDLIMFCRHDCVTAATMAQGCTYMPLVINILGDLHTS